MIITISARRARATNTPSRYPRLVSIEDSPAILTTPPADFDAIKLPIIAVHVFGLSLVGDVAADTVSDLRFCRHIEQLHRLGPRPMAELLAEIGADEAAGGANFPPPPLHEIWP